MPFLDPLRIESVRGTSDKFKLLEKLRYKCLNKVIIEVPAGFETDFASVPRIFRGLFPKAGKYRDAAVIHDYLYKYQGFEMFSRADVDSLFKQAMAELGVSWLRRNAIYSAVRLGGGLYWKQCKEN